MIYILYTINIIHIIWYNMSICTKSSRGRGSWVLLPQKPICTDGHRIPISSWRRSRCSNHFASTIWTIAWQQWINTNCLGYGCQKTCAGSKYFYVFFHGIPERLISFNTWLNIVQLTESCPHVAKSMPCFAGLPHMCSAFQKWAGILSSSCFPKNPLMACFNYQKPSVFSVAASHGDFRPR